MNPSPQAIMVDGPRALEIAPTRRQRTVCDMAQTLIEWKAYGNEPASIVALIRSGRFRSFDIAAWIDDARQVAAQEVVAREMGE